jgi:hypothetical protein
MSAPTDRGKWKKPIEVSSSSSSEGEQAYLRRMRSERRERRARVRQRSLMIEQPSSSGPSSVGQPVSSRPTPSTVPPKKIKIKKTWLGGSLFRVETAPGPRRGQRPIMTLRFPEEEDVRPILISSDSSQSDSAPPVFSDDDKYDASDYSDEHCCSEKEKMARLRALGYGISIGRKKP